jgi:hypothetical protein
MAQDNNNRNGDRIVIGKTTRCVDPSCTGWLVDSFSSGKYWIQCIDKKHSVDQNHVDNRKAGSIGGETTSQLQETTTTQSEEVIVS